MSYYLIEEFHLYGGQIKYKNFCSLMDKERNLIQLTPDAYIKGSGIALFKEDNLIDFLRKVSPGDENLLLKSKVFISQNISNAVFVRKNIEGDIVKDKIVYPTKYNFKNFIPDDVLEKIFNNALIGVGAEKTIKNLLTKYKVKVDDLDALVDLCVAHNKKRFIIKEIPKNLYENLSLLEKMRTMAIFNYAGNLINCSGVLVEKDKKGQDFCLYLCDCVTLSPNMFKKVSQVWIKEEELDYDE